MIFPFPESEVRLVPLIHLRRIQVAESTTCRLPFTVDLHGFEAPFADLGVCFSLGERRLIETVACECELPEDLTDKVLTQIENLEGERYELWPADHNLNEGHHFPDPWGDASFLLATLERSLPIVRPPVNHNKISSRKQARLGCDGFHIDAFKGMQINEEGKRTRIWRYFMNLADQPRTAIVCLHDPELVDRHVPLLLSPGYLTGLIAACEGRLRAVVLETPPRDRRRNLIHGFKILTTHLLHCEYGPKGDLLAVVNSLR